ncbi:MAG: serine O-acetyltransferase [Campylobacterales bacterium]|nr:serine O-acetyltransferase [Campylobacterales bacterium]
MKLLAQIREDFRVVLERDPAIRSKIELFFNYPGLWALFWHRIAHRLYLGKFKVLARVLMGLSQIFTHIDIHPAARIGRRVFIDHGIGVVIGETSVVGDDVTIYQGVTLGGVSLAKGKRHPTIEQGVVIGSGAKILGNITIGANSRIGANSVVIKNVPEDSTAVGIPARVIKKGPDKSPYSHNKLPNIDTEMFRYMLKRIELLENALISGDKDIITKDEDLANVYQDFIKSLDK